MSSLLPLRLDLAYFEALDVIAQQARTSRSSVLNDLCANVTVDKTLDALRTRAAGKRVTLSGKARTTSAVVETEVDVALTSVSSALGLAKVDVLCALIDAHTS